MNIILYFTKCIKKKFLINKSFKKINWNKFRKIYKIINSKLMRIKIK